MARCYPTRDQLGRLRVPLTQGEAYLLEGLLQHLDDSFEIFVQPFLNGDRPDFVVVRRNFGVLVLEVKDWELRNYRNPSGALSAWILVQNGAIIASPLAQAQKYKKNFYDLHVDLLFERNVRDRRAFSVVQPAVYFHNASTREVTHFCGRVPYMHLIGRDAVNTDGLSQLCSMAGLCNQSRIFDEQLYQSFRRFLVPPEHTTEIGQPINYTVRQSELIESRLGARQKVRGVAGCGKTKVLAARAVNAYRRTGNTVLILTFNITLRNYIHDRINEVRLPFPWSGFEITNYHQFISTQANNHNIHYDDILVAANDEDLFAPVAHEITRYDAILVDEVQDYEYVWLKVLLKYFLCQDGEFVVFGDEKQNVYGRSMGEDRFPRVPSTPGRWNELKKSFRLDSVSLRIAKEFQKHFFNGRYVIDDDAEPRQEDLFATDPGAIRYISAIGFSGSELYDIVREESLTFNIHPNDLVILTPTFDTLREIEYGFRTVAHERTTHGGETKEEYNRLREEHRAEHEFYIAIEGIRRGRKLHFWGNAGTSKFSTIHSFKGWEAHTLILVIADTDGVASSGGLDELIYVALTRAQKNLVIIDTVSDRYQSLFEALSQG